jgi:hypothetical protein
VPNRWQINGWFSYLKYLKEHLKNDDAVSVYSTARLLSEPPKGKVQV